MVVTVAIVSGATLLIITLMRLVGTTITHRTIRKAVDANPDLAEGLPKRLAMRREGFGDDRLAIILIAASLLFIVRAAPLAELFARSPAVTLAILLASFALVIALMIALMTMRPAASGFSSRLG